MSGAYCPDLPGLGAAGDSREELQQLIGEALPLHIAAAAAVVDDEWARAIVFVVLTAGFVIASVNSSRRHANGGG